MDQVQTLLEEVMRLEREITEARVGDPRLAAVSVRLEALEVELQQARGVAAPLIEDAGAPPSSDETAVENLERARRSLRHALASKRDSKR